jgi:hypothetical protein
VGYTSDQVRQLVISLIVIVDGLKAQPGFDIKAFEANMVEAASRYGDEKDHWIRMVLELAAGKEPPSDLQKSAS